MEERVNAAARHAVAHLEKAVSAERRDGLIDDLPALVGIRLSRERKDGCEESGEGEPSGGTAGLHGTARSGSVVASPGLLEILGEFFNGRMQGTRARAAIRDDDPGCDADEYGAQDRRDTFEVVHSVAVLRHTVPTDRG